EEALGNLAKAEDLYRKALDTAKGMPTENRYRIALARLLLRDRGRPAEQEAPPMPPPDAKPDPKGKLGQLDSRDDAAAVIALLITGVQPGIRIDDDGASKEERERIAKAIELANELIRSKLAKDRAQGHMILGQALAKQGKRTEGVQEFI